MVSANLRLDLLGFDVLSHIVRSVEDAGTLYPDTPYPVIKPGSLISLSLVNKGIRDICIPRLFRRSLLSNFPGPSVYRPSSEEEILKKVQQMDQRLVLGTHVR